MNETANIAKEFKRMRRNSIIKVFIERDGMTPSEAFEYFKALREEIMETLETGGSYDEVEDIMLAEGLEMDYILDII